MEVHSSFTKGKRKGGLSPAYKLDLEINSYSICTQEPSCLHLGLRSLILLQAPTGIQASPKPQPLPYNLREGDGCAREATNTVSEKETNGGDNGKDRMESEEGGGDVAAC